MGEWVTQLIEDVQRGASTSLDLSHLRLQEIPDEIFACTRLEWLDLRDNDLQVIPDRIRDLPNLAHLDLTNNPIQELPDIPGLVLDLDGYIRLARLLTPDHIKGLTIVEKQPYQPSPIEAILELPRLRRLRIEGRLGRTVGSLISRIDRLLSLEDLTLVEVNLAAFPIGIRSLKELRRLRLVSTGLSHLPDWIGELDNLIHLNVSGNDFDRLPDGMQDLHALRYCSLYGNPLRDFPRCLLNLKSLEILDLYPSGARSKRSRPRLSTCPI